jgi:hypothetical protein
VTVSSRALEPDEVISVIAQVLSKSGLATTTVGAEVAFRVHGDRGGDWIVDLRQAGGAWSTPSDPELVERCKTTVYAEREAFSHLITDPDRLDADLKSGFLVIEGDRTVLTRLGRLLAQSGGMISQRARQSRQTKQNNRRSKPCR